MTFSEALQHFTLASWLRGYAQGLKETNKEGQHDALIVRLERAADLLHAVYTDHTKGDL